MDSKVLDPVELNIQLDEYQVLDIQDGIEKVGGNKDLFETLLQLLLTENIPEAVNILNSAFANHDWHNISKIAHKLKGAALYCGATKLQHSAKCLEQAENCDTEIRIYLYQQLHKVITETRNSINSYLKA